MADKENVTPLKTLVFSMGLVLVGGTVLLAGLVYQKVTGEKTAGAFDDCKGGTIDVKGHGIVTDSSLMNDTLRLTFQGKGGRREVMMVDACSGKVKGSFFIEADGFKN